MDKSEITRLLAAFEALVRNIEGVEYWFARELQPLLEYSQWRKQLQAGPRQGEGGEPRSWTAGRGPFC